MRTPTALLCLISFATLAVAGCASVTVVQGSASLNPNVLDLIGRQTRDSDSTTISQLMQVTIRAPKVSRRFNIELYHTDSSTVFYCGGFIGRGSFKGVIRDTVAAVYLLREREYFDGPITDLSTIDISRYGRAIALIRSLLSGDLIGQAGAGAETTEWERAFSLSKGRVRRVEYIGRSDSIAVEAVVGSYKGDFPYYQIKQCNITDLSRDARVKLKLIEQRCGEVPAIKLAMPDVSGWERIDRLRFE